MVSQGEPHPLASLSNPAHYRSQATAGPSSNSGGTALVQSPRQMSGSPQPASTGGDSVGGTAGGSSVSKVKRKKGTTVKVASLGGAVDSDGDEEPGKKRQKTALSCGECKRRKIKCDRKVPCVSCIKRGEPEKCNWEEARIDPEPQPFALGSDLKRVAMRLVQMEQFLQTLPPELRAGAPRPQPLSFYIPGEAGSLVPSGNGGFATNGGGRAALPPSSGYENSSIRDFETEGRSVYEADLNSDTEDAAVKLEATAFGSQQFGTTQFTTADSNPFLGLHGPKSDRCCSSPVELTRELTSIVAPKVNPEAAFSCSVQLGLDYGLPVEEVEAARRAAVAKVLVDFPEKEMSLYLVRKYYEDFDWIHHLVFQRTFEAELERYWEMHAEGRETEIDPLWFSLYAMIIALSLDGLRTRSLPGDEGWFQDFPASYALRWYAAAQRLLILGDWLGTPQVRSILTVILLGQYIQISSFGGQANRFLGWLSGAVRIAQVLGLHNLGDNPEVMPPDDPCWPPGSNAVKRESALRIFGVLIFMDWLAATTRFPTYMIHTSQFTSAPLSNIDDKNLSSTDWRITPLPRSVATDTSFEYVKYMIAMQSRKVFDSLVTDNSNFSYETVLELDKGYRQILECLPDTWKVEHAKKEATTPKLRWKRHVVQESIHSRIVRLHRPFLTRGYSPHSRFAYSTRECVESAKVVIASQSNIPDVTNNIWFLYNHALGAAIVLFADLFHAIDSDYSDVEIEAKKETLVAAFEIFGKHETIRSPVLRAVVQQGSRILSGLFMAEEKRRVLRTARKLSGGKGNPPGQESFAQVLERITAQLDIRSVHAPLVPPTAPYGARITNPADPPTTSTTPTVPAPQTTRIDLPPAPDFDSALSNMDAANFDHLANMFFQDLGMPTGGAAGGATFWSNPTPTGSSNGTGVTPPDSFGFLNGLGQEWGAAAGNVLPTTTNPANALAASALLEQMTMPW
ncbi:hypothetical protein T439DRAFT_326448 [Meredithblackwellia eburnea MCA 4105]